MTLTNEIYASIGKCEQKVLTQSYKILILLLAPFTPHLCEEIWEKLGEKTVISISPWPKYNENYLISDTLEIPVQINGKMRGVVSVTPDITEEALKEAIISDDKFKAHLENKQIVKFIYVAKKIANIIVK
jgi:leucyl-tRNA synthetase